MTRSILLLLLLALFTLPLAAASPSYVRAAIALEASSSTTVLDRNCTSTSPPALFGCGSGNDGGALAARGEFGRGVTFVVGAGCEMGSRARVEATLVHRPSLDLDAEANFIGVAGDQPVRASARSTSAMLTTAVDIAPQWWRIKPFIAAGFGLARNHIGVVRYDFPSIAPNAVTLTSGGAHTSLAWSAAVGASLPLSRALALELELRHTDLGEMRTSDGPARIIRPTRDLLIDIAGTRADLERTGVVLSLRYSLR